MKIQVLKENLTKTVQLAAKFALTRAQLPVLGYMLIEAGEQGIYVTTTSLDVGIKLRMAGKILEKGSVLVPAKLIGELVQGLPLGGIELASTNEGGLTVVGQRTRARIQGLSAGDFPAFPVEKEKQGEAEVAKLLESYEKVGYAVSTDEARPILTGFLWHWKKGLAAATDGYRLSIVHDPRVWGVKKSELESLVVPGKAMVQLLMAFTEMQCERISFGFQPETQQLLITSGDVVGVVRILVGDFPKYEGIMPGESSVEVLMNREQLLAAVRSVAIFARDSANVVRLEIKDGKMEISANAAQVGENMVDVEVEQIKQGNGLIAFNSKYLLDFLTHSEGERVGFGMTDSLRPGLFYVVGVEEFKHVIMPVRVK